MTKGKVIQIGLFISLIGLISYKFAPQIGIDNFTATTLSSCILILIVNTWVTSYVYRVVNGKMTFMEQRKRYRKEYEKVVNDKLETKFNSLSKEEQQKLMEDLEKLDQSNKPIGTPNVSSEVIASKPDQNTVGSTGLTATETAWLSNEEKAMRLKQKGLA